MGGGVGGTEMHDLFPVTKKTNKKKPIFRSIIIRILECT